MRVFPTVVVPGHSPDTRQDGGSWRRGEDTAGHAASQHAGPDVAGTEGLVARPASRDQANLPRLYLDTFVRRMFVIVLLVCLLFPLTFSLTTTLWPSSSLRPGLIMVSPSRASSTTALGLLISFFPETDIVSDVMSVVEFVYSEAVTLLPLMCLLIYRQTGFYKTR